MAEIIVEHAVKRFGKFVAIDNVSLQVADKEFIVLLGPSGCGKTTLLRAIAGLGMVDEGRILIGSRDVTYMQPKERNVSMVFQNYAIFPHMTVFDNIAFGLKMRKVARGVIQERVETAAKLLHIEAMLDRLPGTMSGGQRQRIAVARAIAFDADALLMDEPLSNLDALLRLEMRAELKALLRRLEATTIYVTHDQIEALSMGDRIAVMRSGKIIQIDAPTRIYDVPVDQFVGSFIGNPPMNFLPARVEHSEGQITVKLSQLVITPPDYMGAALRPYEGKDILIGIRAENTEVKAAPSEGALPVRVEVVEPLGSQNLLTIIIDRSIIKVSTHPDFPAEMGGQVWLHFPVEKIRWIDRDSGRAITPALEQVAS
ncbi:MAG: ABC transporter ATP-binding protein [Anaerolineae bacterium]|nr:ABC transporter ATP-binding protein [Anaerolineae bacterium]